MNPTIWLIPFNCQGRKKTNFENVTPRFNIRNIIDTTVSCRIKLHAVSNYIIQLKQWFIAISFIEWAKFPEPSSGSEWLSALTPSLSLYQSLILNLILNLNAYEL